jgi:hypothetical protein
MSYTQDLRNIIAQIRSVLKGDTVEPEDHNLQTDCIKKIADLLDDLDTRLKSIPNYKLIAFAEGYHHTSKTGTTNWCDINWYPHDEEYVINQTPFAHINEVLKPKDILIFEIKCWGRFNLPYHVTLPAYWYSYAYFCLEVYNGGKSYILEDYEHSKNEMINVAYSTDSIFTSNFTGIVYIPDGLDKLGYYLNLYMYLDDESYTRTNITVDVEVYDMIKLFRMI